MFAWHLRRRKAPVGLLITFLLGIFVLIGAAIAAFAKNEHAASVLSVAVALGAIVMLLLMDLLPETIEGIEHIGWVATLVAVVLGFGLLALLDRFLPESDTAHHEKHEHCRGSSMHVSVAVVIALTIHNVIEGMSVFGVASQSVMSALMLAFGIGIHNVPMGMIIYSGARGESIPKRVAILAIAALSTFLGGLVMFALGTGPDDRVVHFIIALTVGLLLYIVICELLPHAISAHDRRLTIIGVIAGAVVVFLGVSLAGMA